MATKAELNGQLDELAMQLLSLCQSLVDAKLVLETCMKEGFINLAHSRYSMPGGPSTISKLQLPNEDWEPFEANSKVSLSQCVRQEIDVKFNYLSLETLPSSRVENLSSNLVSRSKKQERERNPTEKAKQPLRWFGVLVPNSMRQSQKNFTKAIEFSVEAINIQNEIRGLMGKRQMVLRQLKKLESAE